MCVYVCIGVCVSVYVCVVCIGVCSVCVCEYVHVGVGLSDLRHMSGVVDTTLCECSYVSNIRVHDTSVTCVCTPVCPL